MSLQLHKCRTIANCQPLSIVIQTCGEIILIVIPLYYSGEILRKAEEDVLIQMYFAYASEKIPAAHKWSKRNISQ